MRYSRPVESEARPKRPELSTTRWKSKASNRSPRRRARPCDVTTHNSPPGVSTMLSTVELGSPSASPNA
ncbi:MAG: hypothetical protein QM757_05570 [Paludibaculum sp.]